MLDRKSTRLNSSHVAISYAFYCSRAHPAFHSFPTRRSSDLCCKMPTERICVHCFAKPAFAVMELFIPLRYTVTQILEKSLFKKEEQKEQPPAFSLLTGPC